MTNIKISFLLTILFLFALKPELYSQTVFEPVGSDVYSFLERLYLNDVIEYHSEIKPLTRGEIAGYLFEASKNSTKLTTLDKKELDYYYEEFADEISLLSKSGTLDLPRTEFFTTGQTNRFRLFNYRDSVFSFYLDPVLGYSISNTSKSTLRHRMNGLEFYGYYTKNWGYSLNFRDNLESGDNIDINKQLTSDPGIVLTKTDLNSIQYDDVRASINFGWESGTISIGKDYINLGSGLNGQIILSNKAPSFPYIKLDFFPVKWMRFVYFHGWLKSNIPDSSTFRYSPVEGRYNLTDVQKFIAAHLLSFYIGSNLTISLGESVVYSDNIQPVYFVPVMFFRLADHYLSTGSSSSGNAQMFADFSYRIQQIKTKLYSTLFIDELSLENIFKGGNLSAIGYTIGAHFSEIGIRNSSFVVEYTRINPFVYQNSNDAQLFTNHNYQLGHWIGSNGDFIHLSYRQGLIRGLYLSISGYYLRKGKLEDPEEQYQLPYPSFLYGAKRTEMNISVLLKYEPFHNIFSQFKYVFSDISDEDPARTPVNLLGKKNTFSISISYGM